MMKNNHTFKRVAVAAVALTLGMGMAFAQNAAETYEVKAGDTLYGISQRYGISVESLKASNPAVGEDNVISIGQLLVIPTAQGTTTTTTRTVSTPATEYTTTTTTTIETRYDVDNTTFLKGDMVVNLGVGVGSVRKRGEYCDRDLATFTQQLSVDYCFDDDVLGGSAMGVGLMVNNGFGGKYKHNGYDFRREDLSVLTTLSLHHQFAENLDTYAKVGMGVSVLTDESESKTYEATYANPAFSIAFLVGARYYVGSQWGIYVEAGLPNAAYNKKFGSSFSYLSGGLSYRF